MPTFKSTRSVPQRLLGYALATGAALVFLPISADAHFILDQSAGPPSWMSQDSLGLPEKLGPCGDEGGGTPTNIVTAYQSGQTLTVTVDEIIFHPGHYRIALAESRSQLPPEPVVTPGSTACGTAVIESPAVYPVLADNVFAHTAAFSGTQTVQIKLPSNVTCTKCTLQVIEFMSDHALNVPGGCFYHHCADLSITSSSTDGGEPADSGGSDTGVMVTPDAATGPDGAGSPDAQGGFDASNGGTRDSGEPGAGLTPATSGGCSCSVPAGKAPFLGAFAGLFTLAALAALVSRRKRR